MTASGRALSLRSRGRNFGRALAALVFVLVAVPRPAASQDAPDPQAPEATPPPVTPTIQPRRLDLGMSLFDAYDITTVTDGQPGLTTDPRLRQNAAFSSATASLTYSQAGRDNAFGASAGTGFRYYSITPTLLPVNYYAGLNFSTKLTQRLQISGAEAASFSPFYSFGSALVSTDATQTIAPQLDQGVAVLNTVSSDSSASLTWQISRKGSFSSGYSFGYIETPESAYRVRTQAAHGTYQYQKTRYLNLRLGYGYSRSALSGQAVPYFASHNIDVGIGYRKPLSFSRRSVLGFNVGSTLFTEGASRSFYVTGDASLTHQLSRLWAAALVYNRSVVKVGGLAAPFISDTAGGSVGGLVTQHFGLYLSGGYAQGSAASGSQNDYHSINASSRISYTLTRFLPLYAEYVYYYYQFSTAIGLAPGFPVLVNRHGVRTGLSYAVPLIGRRPTRT